MVNVYRVMDRATQMLLSCSPNFTSASIARKKHVKCGSFLVLLKVIIILIIIIIIIIIVIIII